MPVAGSKRSTDDKEVLPCLNESATNGNPSHHKYDYYLDGVCLLSWHYPMVVDSQSHAFGVGNACCVFCLDIVELSWGLALLLMSMLLICVVVVSFLLGGLGFAPSLSSVQWHYLMVVAQVGLLICLS